MRTVEWDEGQSCLQLIDQRRLPHERVEAELHTVDDAIYAIQTLMVRGAPLIGVTAAYGVVLAAAAAVTTAVDESLQPDFRELAEKLVPVPAATPTTGRARRAKAEQAPTAAEDAAPTDATPATATATAPITSPKAMFTISLASSIWRSAR